MVLQNATRRRLIAEESDACQPRDYLLEEFELLSRLLRIKGGTPVMLPPGRFRSATKSPLGSITTAETIGMVVVAPFAARLAIPPIPTRMSTFWPTSSAARSGS